MQTFTLHELSEYDGTNGKPVYVAYNGKVYDLSDAPNWTSGSHYQHFAGEDLTEAMGDAPHNDYMMKDFRVVGDLDL
jgi:predicted heme/steroid binding protein